MPEMQKTNGLNIKYSELTVMQEGHKINLIDANINEALNTSKMLQKGVTLSSSFSGSIECQNYAKFEKVSV